MVTQTKRLTVNLTSYYTHVCAAETRTAEVRRGILWKWRRAPAVTDTSGPTRWTVRKRGWHSQPRGPSPRRVWPVPVTRRSPMAVVTRDRKRPVVATVSVAAAVATAGRRLTFCHPRSTAWSAYGTRSPLIYSRWLYMYSIGEWLPLSDLSVKGLERGIFQGVVLRQFIWPINLDRVNVWIVNEHYCV